MQAVRSKPVQEQRSSAQVEVNQGSKKKKWEEVCYYLLLYLVFIMLLYFGVLLFTMLLFIILV